MALSPGMLTSAQQKHFRVDKRMSKNRRFREAADIRAGCIVGSVGVFPGLAACPGEYVYERTCWTSSRHIYGGLRVWSFDFIMTAQVVRQHQNTNCCCSSRSTFPVISGVPCTSMKGNLLPRWAIVLGVPCLGLLLSSRFVLPGTFQGCHSPTSPYSQVPSHG